MTDIVIPALDPGNYDTYTDPDPTIEWTPPLGIRDALLLFPEPRTARLNIVGGKTVHVRGLEGSMSIPNQISNPVVSIGGTTATSSDVCILGARIDGFGGGECDGVKTSGAGTRANGPQFKRRIWIKDTRIGPLRGQTYGPQDGVQQGDTWDTDDFGNTTAGTHADVMQLSGGALSVAVEDCTFMSRYAGLQWQQEAFAGKSFSTPPGASAPKVNVNSVIRIGTSTLYTYNTATASGVSVGSWMEALNVTPSTYRGSFEVTAVANSTTFTVDLGTNRTPSGSGSGGTVQEVWFPYTTGDLRINRCNFYSLQNGQMYLRARPDGAVQAVRVGCRPATEVATDETPLLSDAWGGSCDYSNFWIKPWTTGIGTQTFAGLILPGSGSNIYPTARATITGSVGSQIATYPSWPAVTGQINEGVPPGGDYCPSWLPGIGYPNVAP